MAARWPDFAPPSTRVPLGWSQGPQPVRGDYRNRVQRGAQGLGQQLDPVQVAHRGEHVRAVCALTPARLEQSSVSRGVQHAGEQALTGIPGQQPGAELAEHGVVEAGIGQVKGEQILPVDPGARTASAACRSLSPSRNCRSVTSERRQGVYAGWPRRG